MCSSGNAAKILELLEKQRADFRINNMRAGIVSIVSDGTSVKKRLGKIFKVNYQLYFAHGQCLIVCEILYKK